ncbi:MAG: winged helix-turn-helix transcriptional regulator [Fibrobacter sp.]|nr:winged helix-turn-helix transcriptional regulator [Fibrobacter sp.]
MIQPNLALISAQAEIVKAMAHPTRLMIIKVLSEREHCVCELTELAGVDMSTVSKHLSVLKSAGIVAIDKRGLMVFYRLVMPCTVNFMGCLESVIKARAQAQLELVK